MIALLGGFVAVQRIIEEECGEKLVLATFYNWLKPKPGTGGLVPAKYHQGLIDGGVKLGKDITSADFFEKPTGRAAPPAGEGAVA